MIATCHRIRGFGGSVCASSASRTHATHAQLDRGVLASVQFTASATLESQARFPRQWWIGGTYDIGDRSLAPRDFLTEAGMIERWLNMFRRKGDGRRKLPPMSLSNVKDVKLHERSLASCRLAPGPATRGSDAEQGSSWRHLHFSALQSCLVKPQ
jgi:hypothetical protein